MPLSFIAAPDAKTAKTLKEAPADSETHAPQEWLRCQRDEDEAGQTVAGLPSKDKWVLFNVNMGGAYRVQYDEENWRLLAVALADATQRNAIGVVSRAQVRQAVRPAGQNPLLKRKNGMQCFYAISCPLDAGDRRLVRAGAD